MSFVLYNTINNVGIMIKLLYIYMIFKKKLLQCIIIRQVTNNITVRYKTRFDNLICLENKNNFIYYDTFASV